MNNPSPHQLMVMNDGYKSVYTHGFQAYSPSYVEGTPIGENYGPPMIHMPLPEWHRQYSSRLYISTSCANTRIAARGGHPVPIREPSPVKQKRRNNATRLNKGQSVFPVVSRPDMDPAPIQYVLAGVHFVPAAQQQGTQYAFTGVNAAPVAQQQCVQDVSMAFSMEHLNGGAFPGQGNPVVFPGQAPDAFMGSNDDNAAPPQGIEYEYLGYNEFAPAVFAGGYNPPVAQQQYYQEAPMGQTFDFAAAQAQGIPGTFTGFDNGFAASYPVDTTPAEDFQDIFGDLPYLPGLMPHGNLDAFAVPIDNGSPAPPHGFQDAFLASNDNGVAPIEGSQELFPDFADVGAYLANDANWKTHNN
jgi:hypothetical protein